MTQLTYTIAHVRVGAENYWEEVGGFMSQNLELLLLEWETQNQKEGWINNIDNWRMIKRTHSLSPLAEKLGAMIFGGFEDEKDFYVVMPTFDKFKVGDCFNTNCGEFAYDDIIHMNHLMILGYGKSIDDDIRLTGGTLWDRADEIENYVKKGNLFQEYARTGIVENEFYKQFFNDL